ncbi:Trp biosynthesis-associated membrane protein [Oerskovia flava]|uniref:Trp biosynthesis-associated membrane protein n=1 Tax=Oerskovia flava TaxID=2986422 RepID=UPI0022407EA3|nr:Trp biosynthesis-associated membrane protein [Oerskovia sp. JB1-3-2]
MTRARSVLLLLALGLAALGAAAPTWLTTSGASVLDPDVAVTLTGTDAAPGVAAGALVLAAAALALGLVGRVGRWVVLAVAAASGVVVGGSAVSFLLDPDGPARSAVAQVTGVTEATGPVEVTVFPVLAAALGAVVVLAVVAVALASRRWTQGSARHERGSAPPAGQPADEQATWDALSRGEDPTGPAR